jgi:hypothetical protein
VSYSDVQAIESPRIPKNLTPNNVFTSQSVAAFDFGGFGGSDMMLAHSVDAAVYYNNPYEEHAAAPVITAEMVRDDLRKR